MRLFVAVDPSPEAARHLAVATQALRLSARPGAHDWHVTVAFLGEIDDADLSTIEAALARAAASAPPGRLRIAGSGRFGDAVLWAGLDGDLDALSTLAATVRAELGAGFDERPFRPHLTLARRGRHEPVAAFKADVAMLADYEGPDWPMDRLNLMRSRFPQVQGYESVGSWPLTG